MATADDILMASAETNIGLEEAIEQLAVLDASIAKLEEINAGLEESTTISKPEVKYINQVLPEDFRLGLEAFTTVPSPSGLSDVKRVTMNSLEAYRGKYKELVDTMVSIAESRSGPKAASMFLATDETYTIVADGEVKAKPSSKVTVNELVQYHDIMRDSGTPVKPTETIVLKYAAIAKLLKDLCEKDEIDSCDYFAIDVEAAMPIFKLLKSFTTKFAFLSEPSLLSVSAGTICDLVRHGFDQLDLPKEEDVTLLTIRRALDIAKAIESVDKVDFHQDFLEVLRNSPDKISASFLRSYIDLHNFVNELREASKEIRH